MGRSVDEQPTVPQGAANAQRAQEHVAPPPPAAPALPAAPAEAARPKAGPRTLGRYHLLFQIARGGMGAVYAAVSRQQGGIDRVFAVKVLHSRDQGVEEVEDFIQEARLTSHIDHPNVLETLELGMEEGEPFLVMPLLRGVPLSRLAGTLRRRGERLPSELSVWIAAQVAAGLHAAHEITSPAGDSLHVVHRDVSPQNVMLGYRGEVVLLDFGVAKLFESNKATASGVIKGKFAYMSPEQLRAQPLDRTTDVYALGVVLFELLTGRPLYSDLSPSLAAMKIDGEPTPRLGDHWPEAPAALEDILLRAMARSPAERYASALELRDALRGYLREVGAAADETQLAELVSREFAAERLAFDEKLRDALAALDGEGAISADPEPGGAPPPLAISRAGPAPKRPLGLFTVGAVACLIGVLGSAAWVATRARQRAASDAPEAVAGASARLSSPSATATTATAPSGPVTTTRPDASSPETSSPDASSPETSSSGPRSAVRPGSRASAAVAASSPPVAPAAVADPPPAASSPSVKGEPFRKW